MRRTALALLPALLLVGCGEGGDSDSAASTTVTVTTTAAAPTTQAEDVAGRSNCVSASLAYAPIEGGLSGGTDLEAAVSYFDSPDIDPATSDAGKAAAVAIAELNFQLASAKAYVLTGRPVDAAKLQALLSAVEEACAPVL